MPTKTKNLKISLSASQSEILQSKLQETGMNLTQYVEHIAQTEPIFLSDGLEQIDRLTDRIYAHFQSAAIPYAKNIKGETTMSDNRIQRHIRITPAALDRIERMAKENNMSLSTYIGYVATNFDLNRIQQQQAEINRKLDTILTMLDLTV